MLTGILLIVFGIAVAVFPQILVAIVSTFFIMTGLALLAMSWQMRRLRRTAGVPFVNWIIRF